MGVRSFLVFMLLACTHVESRNMPSAPLSTRPMVLMRIPESSVSILTLRSSELTLGIAETTYFLGSLRSQCFSVGGLTFREGTTIVLEVSSVFISSIDKHTKGLLLVSGGVVFTHWLSENPPLLQPLSVSLLL